MIWNSRIAIESYYCCKNRARAIWPSMTIWPTWFTNGITRNNQRSNNDATMRICLSHRHQELSINESMIIKRGSRSKTLLGYGTERYGYEMLWIWILLGLYCYTWLMLMGRSPQWSRVPPNLSRKMMSNHQTCHPNHIFGQIAVQPFHWGKIILRQTHTIQVNFEPQFWRGMVLMRFNTNQMIRLGQLGNYCLSTASWPLFDKNMYPAWGPPYAVPGWGARMLCPIGW